VDSIFLMNTGRLSEATTRVRQRRETDPLSINASYGWQIMLTLTGHPDEAQAEYVRSRSLAGENRLADSFGVLRLLQSNQADSDSLRAQLELAARNGDIGQLFGNALIDKLQNPESALAELRRRFSDPTMQSATAMMWVAGFADHFGDSELALEALRRSYVDLGGTNIGMLWRPYHDKQLHNDPRFKEILRDLGLVDYFRASGNYGDFCAPIAGGADFECR